MRRAAALFIATVLVAGGALALTPTGAVCFDDDGGGGSIYILERLKLPKRPLDAAPVVGTRLGHVGVTGTAFRDDAGKLHMSLFTSDPCFLKIDFEDSLSGTAFYNCPGGSTSSSNWTPRDCRTVTF